MPLFGKKKKEAKHQEAMSNSYKPAPPGGYPAQGAYPTQGAYPAQAAYPEQQPMAGYGPNAGAPPPYTPYPTTGGAAAPPPTQQYAGSVYPGLAETTTQRGYAQYPANVGPGGAPIAPQAPMPMRPAYGGTTQTMAAPYGQYAPGQQQHVVYATQQPVAAFDAGARFQSGQVRVPPPPPGCMPNAAQMAAAQGQSVQVAHKKQDFWSGSGGGGYTSGF